MLSEEIKRKIEAEAARLDSNKAFSDTHKDIYAIGLVKGAELATEWISVKDRLPDECVNVIGWVSGKDSAMAVYWDGANWGDDNSYTHWNVTHWQKIPKPPTP